jgi:acetyltransferase-like isoleucine patch superfamily enzyme
MTTTSDTESIAMGSPATAEARSLQRKHLVATRPSVLKRALKWTGNTVALAIVAIPAATCGLEARFTKRIDIFLFWGQFFGMVPGLPGNFLRRAYGVLTLKSCPWDCQISFMSWFTDRRVELGRGVYIGPRSSIAGSIIGEGAAIGSNVSIVGGKRQHRFDESGRLVPTDSEGWPRVCIGEQTWVGEAAVLMVDVGSRCIIAAGSVVSTPVPDCCIVGGNPARFIGRTMANQDDRQAEGDRL